MSLVSLSIGLFSFDFDQKHNRLDQLKFSEETVQCQCLRSVDVTNGETSDHQTLMTMFEQCSMNMPSIHWHSMVHSDVSLYPKFWFQMIDFVQIPSTKLLSGAFDHESWSMMSFHWVLNEYHNEVTWGCKVILWDYKWLYREFTSSESLDSSHWIWVGKLQENWDREYPPVRM